MHAIQPNPHNVAYETHLPLRERFNNKVVSVAKEIVADTEKRMQNYLKNIKEVDGGCFYPNDYFNILKRSNQTDRLTFLVTKGSFFHGRAPASCFTMEKNPNSSSGFTSNFFVLKKGVTPSAGLKAIRDGLSLLGCGEICQIAYYEALKSELGEEKFDLLFAADSKTPLSIGFGSSRNPLLPLFLLKDVPQHFSKGEMVRFENTPYYPIKHINGEASGFNTICCDSTQGQERFTTMGLNSQGSTVQQVKQKLFDEYNDNPISREIMTKEVAKRLFATYSSDYLKASAALELKQMDYQEFSETKGGSIPLSLEMNFERITQLAAEPLESVSKLFNSWTTDTWPLKPAS
jgi:hypothetical protein